MGDWGGGDFINDTLTAAPRTTAAAATVILHEIVDEIVIHLRGPGAGVSGLSCK